MIAATENKLLRSQNRVLEKIALAAAASAQSVQIGDQFVQDKSIRGSTISNSQVTTGDGNSIVQSLQQSSTGGGVAELASVLQQLLDKIGAASDLGAMEKHEAKQAVETVAVAAKAPGEEPSRKAVGKALETLTGLLGRRRTSPSWWRQPPRLGRLCRRLWRVEAVGGQTFLPFGTAS